jgi:hypothetical protein
MARANRHYLPDRVWHLTHRNSGDTTLNSWLEMVTEPRVVGPRLQFRGDAIFQNRFAAGNSRDAASPPVAESPLTR